MIKKFIPAFLAISACAGVFLAIQSMLPPPASASGIVPAIVPALVPTANKTSTSATVFALASSNALTASSPVCTNASGDMTTTACTINSVTSTTPVTVNANSTSDQQLMELSLTAGYLNSLGRPFDFFGAGVYTTQTAQTPTLEFKIKLCTVSGCGSGTVVTLVDITSGATTAASSNISWNLRTLGTTAATGATGNLELHGDAHLDLGSALSTASTVYNDTNTAVSSNIDLTAALFVDFTVKFSTNAAGANTCTQREGVVSPGGSTSGGGSSGALTQISQTVLGAAAASVTLSGVSGIYNDLLLSVQGRTDHAGSDFETIVLQVNGDAGTNYNIASIGANNGSANPGQTLATANPAIAVLPGATAPANQAGTIEMDFIGYSRTTFFKGASITTGTGRTGLLTQSVAWWNWQSTAAITAIKVFTFSGSNFLAGSTFTLWGRT